MKISDRLCLAWVLEPAAQSDVDKFIHESTSGSVVLEEMLVDNADTSQWNR